LDEATRIVEAPFDVERDRRAEAVRQEWGDRGWHEGPRGMVIGCPLDASSSPRTSSLPGHEPGSIVQDIVRDQGIFWAGVSGGGVRYGRAQSAKQKLLTIGDGIGKDERVRFDVNEIYGRLDLGVLIDQDTTHHGWNIELLESNDYLYRSRPAHHGGQHAFELSGENSLKRGLEKGLDRRKILGAFVG